MCFSVDEYTCLNMSNKEIFEDSDEDFTASESGEDFSASEDDWKPGKDDAITDEDEDIVTSGGDGGSDDEGPSKGKKAKKR